MFVSVPVLTVPSAGGLCGRRVKGKTENAILRLPFKSYVFRPGVVLPVIGERSRTAALPTVVFSDEAAAAARQAVSGPPILTTEQFGSRHVAASRDTARRSACWRALIQRDCTRSNDRVAFAKLARDRLPVPAAVYRQVARRRAVSIRCARCRPARWHDAAPRAGPQASRMSSRGMNGARSSSARAQSFRRRRLRSRLLHVARRCTQNQW